MLGSDSPRGRYINAIFVGAISGGGLALAFFALGMTSMFIIWWMQDRNILTEGIAVTIAFCAILGAIVGVIWASARYGKK